MSEYKKCTGWWFQGHIWSKWRKSLGGPKEGIDGMTIRNELLKRRCARCGFIQDIWTNSCRIIKQTPKDKEDKLDEV